MQLEIKIDKNNEVFVNFSEFIIKKILWIYGNLRWNQVD